MFATILEIVCDYLALMYKLQLKAERLSDRLKDIL